jgi:hypothetical protein
MSGMNVRVWTLAFLFVFGALCVARAEEEAKEMKAEEFKGKTFSLKEKGKGHVTLTFPAGKKATVTVKSTKETDVNLYVYGADKKVVEKDVSPGPSCMLSFTPKEAGKYTLEVVNLGPGANKSTLKVKLAE